MIEVTVQELAQKNPDGYVVIDVRDESAFGCGHIPGAVNIPAEKLDSAALSKEKELIFCCRSGQISIEIAEKLRAEGFVAFHLKGGYVDWLKIHVRDLAGNDVARKIEEGLRKTYAKRLFKPFARAIVEYGLVKPND